jgi:hypothetical protein
MRPWPLSSSIEIAALSVVFMCNACGVTSSKENDPPSSVSAADVSGAREFFTAYVEKLCDLDLTCGRSVLRYASVEQCQERMLLAFEQATPVELAAVHYDADRGATCLNALGVLSCDSSTGQGVALLTSCTNVFQGDRGVGDACSSQAECKPGLDCAQTPFPGACRVPPQLGEPCPDSLCADGLGCITIRDAATNTRETRCETLGALGAACGSQVRECELGLICDTSASEPVCAPFSALYPKAGLGQTCAINGQCEPDQYCGEPVEGTRVCSQRVAGGGACDPSNPIQCADRHYCSLTGEVGSCVPRLELGAACIENTDCLAGDCITNTCRFRRFNGEACASDEECSSFFCDAGACAAELACSPDAM